MPGQNLQQGSKLMHLLYLWTLVSNFPWATTQANNLSLEGMLKDHIPFLKKGGDWVTRNWEVINTTNREFTIGRRLPYHFVINSIKIANRDHWNLINNLNRERERGLQRVKISTIMEPEILNQTQSSTNSCIGNSEAHIVFPCASEGARIDISHCFWSSCEILWWVPS